MTTFTRNTGKRNRCGKECLRCWKNSIKHTTRTGLDKRQDDNFKVIHVTGENTVISRLDAELRKEKPVELSQPAWVAWRREKISLFHKLKFDEAFKNSEAWDLLTLTRGNDYLEIYEKWFEKLRKKHGGCYVPSQKDIGVFKWKTQHNKWSPMLPDMLFSRN